MDVPGYELLHLAGRGGMGEVWHARHRRTGASVAIKTVPEGASPVATLLVDSEVRALAALDHPSIVRVLDHGWLEDGRGWLALEWCDGGTVEQTPPDRWSEVAQIMEAVLQALAHAHARRVLHRDVKPANVLRGAGRWKLADFGVSVLGQGRPTARVAGTPGFMAPEQAGRLAATQGPWTDLYSVGCLVWTLVSGAAPVPGAAWDPRFPVPTDLLGWVGALLAPDPRDRPRFAAHALRELRGLGAPTGVAAAPTRPPPGSGGASDTFQLDEGDVDVPTAPPVATAPGTVAEAAMPESWRDAEPRISDPRLRDVGVALLPYRTSPLVGRDAVLDALWAELRLARESGPRMVLLYGPSGSGRTRVARQLGMEAHRCGVGDWRTLDVREPTLPPAPVAVVIADEVGDPETAEVVRASFARATAPQLWIVVTEDAGDAGLPDARRIGLSPLTDREVSIVLAGVLPLAPELSGSLVRLADGRPGVALGALQGWARQGALTSTPQGFAAPSDTPPTRPTADTVAELTRRMSEAGRGAADGLSLHYGRALVEAADQVYDRSHLVWWWSRTRLCQDLRELSYLDEAKAMLAALEPSLPVAPPRARGRWLLESAQVARSEGRIDDSCTLAERALTILAELEPDPDYHWFEQRIAADILITGGRTSRALALVQRLLDDPRMSAYQRGWTRRVRVRALAVDGRIEEALDEARQVAHDADAHGFRDLERACRPLAGEMATRLGLLDEATEHLEASSALMRGSYADDAVVHELNVAVLHLRRGRFDDALRTAEQLRADPRIDRVTLARLALEQVEGNAAAGLGRWQHFRACYDALDTLSEGTPITDPDFVHLCDLAIGLAEAAGRDDDAALARRLRDRFAARLSTGP